MYRARRRGPLFLVAALGVLLGLAAAAVISLPRVTGHAPAAAASDISAAAPIDIVFSQAMRWETVEARFHVEPQREGTFHWSGRRLTFLPAEPWGEGERVTVSLDPGAVSLRGLPTLGGTHWTFTTGSARLAFLWPSDGPAGLYAWTPAGGAPVRLAETESGLTDYSISPDGERLIFTVQESQETEIRMLEIGGEGSALVLRCPAGAVCRRPTLSHDGEMLAYEQSEPQSDGSTLRRVWVTPVEKPAPRLAAAPDHPTSAPAWSSRGWLVVYDHTLAAYVLFDQMDAQGSRQAFVVPNALGEPAVWSPDGGALVYAEITFLPASPDQESESPPQFYSHLRKVSVEDGSEVDLTGGDGLLVEDSGPAFSPDGRWIVFSRRGLAPATWTPGRQIWRMRADGTEPMPLTDDPERNHAALTWSADGTRLAYMLFDQLDPTRPSEMWWSWADGRPGSAVPLPEAGKGGYAPQWIP